MFLFTCSLAHVGCDVCYAASGWGWSQAQPGALGHFPLLLSDAFQNILKHVSWGTYAKVSQEWFQVVEFLGAHVSFPDNT